MRNDATVIIVGSGAGGGAAAWRLASSGIDVLVLEAGPVFDPLVDYRQDSAQWETPFPAKDGSLSPYVVAPLELLSDDTRSIRSWSRLTGPFATEGRRLNFGYHHVRGVGGSSLHFTGEAHRLNPRSMTLESDFGIGADWPMTYDDLDPYWQIAEEMTGVAGPTHDKSRPRGSPFPLPPHDFSYASAKLAEGARKSGLSPVANSLAVCSRPYDGRPDCNYCGGCLRGCMRQDKGSVDVTYLRKAIVSGNCRIEPRSEVLKILTDGNKVTGVLVAKNQSIETRYADIVILACGSVQTPRLLLNSADPTSPDGLSNESGLVGRNLMETLLTTTSALHPERLGSHRGLPVDWVAWDYNKPNAIPNVIGGCRFGPAMSESDLVGPVAYATRIVEGWGTEHKQNMRDVFGRVLSIAAIGESLPNNATFVDLADEQDAFGLPVARIHSQLSEMDIARLRFMTGKCREIIAAAGCTDIVEEFSSVDAFSSTHIFGTCRSGVAPDQSVVDSFCRSHRWRNLLVTDSSVFPSSGGGESPGLTIQALAIRAVDNLIRTGAE